jgi:hypothetical protein
MLQKSIICLLPAIFILAGLSCQSQSEPYSEDTATQSATSWLKLIDSGNYHESWKTASDTFKTQISVDDWVNTALAARSPLGDVISRKLTSQTNKTSLPGAPDGEYVVIEFRTEFRSKKAATELITPMLDNDGQWRVSGYYIR